MGLNSNRVENISGNEATIIRVSTTDSTLSPPPLEVHRVCLPPKTTTFQKLKHRLSEIFFPDDPLHRFKNQTSLRKLVLGLQFLFPIFQWAPEYDLRLFRSDVISGLTIASLAIPQVSEKETPFVFLCVRGDFEFQCFSEDLVVQVFI